MNHLSHAGVMNHAKVEVKHLDAPEINEVAILGCSSIANLVVIILNIA